MLTTINYGLKKIELKDSPPDITVINPNWDLIDVEMENHAASLAEIRNMNVTVINRATNLTGTQLITLGFKPRYVRIRALISPASADSTAINYDSDGVAIIDSAGAISYGDIYKYGSATAVSNLLASAIVYLHSGTSYNAAKISAISDTGITLDWSLSGAIPTGTIRMLLEAW